MYLQFSVFLMEGGATSPVARVVLLDVDDNGFFVATDDPVELVTDDAVTDAAAIAC